MSTPENVVKSKIKEAMYPHDNVRIFTNPSGVGFMGESAKCNIPGAIILKSPRRVEFGLFEGSSDFIGIIARTIKAEDVGKTIGQFFAIEAKKPDWNPPKSGGKEYERYLKQLNFIKVINAKGGCAGFARSAEDALALLLLDEANDGH